MWFIAITLDILKQHDSFILHPQLVDIINKGAKLGQYSTYLYHRYINKHHPCLPAVWSFTILHQLLTTHSVIFFFITKVYFCNGMRWKVKLNLTLICTVYILKKSVLLFVSVNCLPVLKADSIKYIMIFRSLLPREVVVGSLPQLVRHLQASSVVVHTYAACAIDKILLIKDNDKAM